MLSKPLKKLSKPWAGLKGSNYYFTRLCAIFYAENLILISMKELRTIMTYISGLQECPQGK